MRKCVINLISANCEFSIQLIPIIIGMALNEISLRRRRKYVPKILIRISRIIAFLGIIASLVCGALAVGKWVITPKMLIFAVLLSPIEAFYSILSSKIIKMLTLRDKNTKIKGVSKSAGLLAAMHNPRVVQSAITGVFRHRSDLIQGMFLLPVLCFFGEIFWAVLFGILRFCTNRCGSG